MNFPFNVSKRIIKAIEKLLQKANPKSPPDDRIEIISKAILYGIPYSEASENIAELTNLIREHEALVTEAHLNGIVWDLFVYDPEGLRRKIGEEKRNKENSAENNNLNMTEKLCAEIDLKIFANSEGSPTVLDFARFIEFKSDKKYTVIHRQFIFDTLNVSKKQLSFSNNLYEEFIKKWQPVIERL